MKLTSSSCTLTPPVSDFIPAGGAESRKQEGSPFAHDARDEEAWQRLIDRLIDWGERAGQTDEDDLLWPTTDAIRSAYDILRLFRENGVPPPDRVVPDGEGGIVFEQASAKRSQRLEFGADGSAEHLVFENLKLVSRERVST
jgi:hypothetical protein